MDSIIWLFTHEPRFPAQDYFITLSVFSIACLNGHFQNFRDLPTSFILAFTDKSALFYLLGLVLHVLVHQGFVVPRKP